MVNLDTAWIPFQGLLVSTVSRQRTHADLYSRDLGASPLANGATQGKNASSSRRSLADLDDRLKNVRQFVGAALYFFGLLFFIQLTQDLWVTEPGRLPFGLTIRGIL
jgi:hypothetical protein